MAYDVFISYRREGGYDIAKHIFDLLRLEGYRVSFDLDTLRNGDFDTQLLKRIDECTDFILILNPTAFDRSIDPNFDRNKDWMRIELAEALERNKNIIPIMLPGFDIYPDNLPEDISEVSRKNGPRHSQEYFDEFYRKLKENFMQSKPIKTSSDTREHPIDGSSYFVLRIHPNEDCQIEKFGESLGTARKDEYFILYLKKGKHRLSFIPLINPDKKKELEYVVKEVNAEDVLDIEFKISNTMKQTIDSLKDIFGSKEVNENDKDFDKSSKSADELSEPDKTNRTTSQDKVKDDIIDNVDNVVFINSASELGKAIESKVSTIIVEGDLAGKIIKIMSVGASKWMIGGGSIVIAIVAILAMPMVTLGGPFGLVAESLVLSAGGAGAVGILGGAATVAAVSIGVGAKNKNAVNKLRKEYSFNKVNDNKVILIRK